MSEFHTHHALTEAQERNEQLGEGQKLVPIAAAIVAVFAALATLFSNHSSVSGLENRTLAGIYQTRAADSYGYYESSRLKIEVNQGLLQSGVVTRASSRDSMGARIKKEQTKSGHILKDAEDNEAKADHYLEDAEKKMASYEKFEVAATLFEVSVVLVSVTALMRTRALFYVGAGTTILGAIFFIIGLI